MEPGQASLGVHVHTCVRMLHGECVATWNLAVSVISLPGDLWSGKEGMTTLSVRLIDMSLSPVELAEEFCSLFSASEL